MNKTKIGLILGSVCLILTCAIVMQIRTINQNITVSDLGVVSDELRDEVLKWKEKYDNSYKELEKAEKELEEERTEATKNDETSKTKEEELYFLISHGILHLLGFDHQTMEDYNFIIDMQNRALNEIQS